MIGLLIAFAVSAGIIYGLAFLVITFLAYKNAPFALARRIYIYRWVKKHKTELDTCTALQGIIEKHFDLLMMIWIQTGRGLFKQHQRDSVWIPQCVNNIRKEVPKNFDIHTDSGYAIEKWSGTCHRMMGIILSLELKESGQEGSIPEGAWIHYIDGHLRKQAAKYYTKQLMACSTEDKLFKWIRKNMSALNGQKRWIFYGIFMDFRKKHPAVVHARFSDFMHWYRYQQKIRIPDIKKWSFNLSLPGLD